MNSTKTGKRGTVTKTTKTTTSKDCGKRPPIFPTRLYDLLENANAAGYADVISWYEDGASFRIHTRCETEIVPILKQRYKSFLRQLQMYGFKRQNKGSLQGIYRHPLFVRSHRAVLHNKSVADFQTAARTLLEKEEEEAAAAALLAQEQQEQAAIHEDEGMSNPVPLSPEAVAAADQLLDSLASTEMVSLPPHPSQHSFPQAGTAWPMQRHSVLIKSNPAPKTTSTLAKTPVATSGPATNAAAATLVPLFPIYYQPTQAAPWQVPPSQVSTTNFQFTPMLEHPQATIQRNNHQIMDGQNYKLSSMRYATPTVVPRSVSTTSVRDNRHQQYSSKPQLMPQLQPLRQPRQAIAAPRTLFGTVLPLPTTARTVTPLCPAFLSAASAPHTAAVAAPVVPEYFAAENDDLDSGLRIDDSTIGTICDNSLSFNRTTFFEKDNDDEDEESGDKYLTRTPPPHDQDVLCGRGGGTNNHSKLLLHYACAARYINPIAPR